MGYVCGHRQQPSDLQHMGTAFTPAKTSPASWDAFRDVEAFVDAVLAELAAMAADGTRRSRTGPKPALTGAALRKAIMAIWCVAFCGMQWRAIGQLCDIPFGTLYYFGAWRREGQEFPCFLVLSGGADGVRASKAEHSVERLDRDLGFDLLGRLGLGAQRVADHALISTHRRLRLGPVI